MPHTFTPLHKPHTLHTLRICRSLAAVDIAAGLDRFPVADLVAASSFDEAQARALGAALLRELAVVQGPPGTGNYIILRNKNILCAQLGNHALLLRSRPQGHQHGLAVWG